jgi:diguanylate cyclase (GGDEF)-like protein/PAS domain S-box-containing protein
MSHHILLIQDDPSDAKVVREALINADERSFKVEWIRRCSEGLARLASERPQEVRGNDGIAAVMVDLSLPDSQGVETFDRIFNAAPQIPTLVLCDAQGEAAAKVAMQHGAQDYLLKTGLDSYLLPKTLGNMIERAAHLETLFVEKERAEVTLNSIGDAVISTDIWGHVTYLNVVAERMTGWSRDEAAGRRLEEVFHIVDGDTRAAVQNPMALAIRENRTVALTPNCLLVRRDGVETAIEDSAAPIRDRRGRVTGSVMVFHDVSGARAIALTMTHLAQHDSLTELPNRNLLYDRLAHAIALAHRRRQKLAVLFLDMDHFKDINDSLGHAIGDRLLQSVAQRLLGCVRGSDTVSRQGGDEFVIVLSEVAGTRDAAVSAEKILLALSSTPHHIDRHDLHLTVSIGVVIYPDDGLEVETLMKNADCAMYQAKECGRNSLQFFKPEMNVRAVERKSLESGFRQAIERRE